MANSKTYLNVPFVEKDAVKSLGGKWDAAKKKWFVPANKDIAPFGKWLSEVAASSSIKSISTKAKSVDNKYTRGVVTHPKDKNFVAYSGDKPPWD